MGRLHWPCMLCLALGACVCAGLPLVTGPLTSSKVRSMLASRNTLSRYQKPYNVCTSDWAPIVTCAGLDDQTQYDGFQVALWRKIATDLGWADSDWTFSCVDWTEMINDLLSPTGSCSFAAAGGQMVRPLRFLHSTD
eukprot:GHUV01033042.1.p1 GENE.GHUV01033042.1~~GHUV01033042.1.p1  ORF type:complete len:137 (+),score=4.37 GHUV01033042.1:332-742(+)